jgi:hypothetical protein
MISDFQVLGIEETADVSIIKSAYRKKMKELHPDLAEEGESFQRHLMFIAVSAAYKRLLGSARSEEAEVPRSPEPPAADQESLAVHADPAYVFYRTGMKYFMLIHPSQWNETQRMLNTKIAGKDEDQELIRQKVMDLVKLFPKAYYYFSIVIHEYPDSVWAYDAAVKTKLIEDRTKRYRHIIESFSSWNTNDRGRIWRYEQARAAELEARKKFGVENEEKWRK